MKKYIIPLLFFATLAHAAPKYSVRIDVQRPDSAHQTMTLYRNADTHVRAVLLENGQPYTNLTGWAGTFNVFSNEDATAVFQWTNASIDTVNGYMDFRISPFTIDKDTYRSQFVITDGTDSLVYGGTGKTRVRGAPPLSGAGTNAFTGTVINWNDYTNYIGGASAGPYVAGTGITFTVSGGAGQIAVNADSLELDDLTDVGTATPTTGHILIGNITGTHFNSQAVVGDVQITYTGSAVIQSDAVEDGMVNWGTNANQVSLNDMPDVNYDSPNTNQVLTWIGGVWTNADSQGGSGGSGTGVLAVQQNNVNVNTNVVTIDVLQPVEALSLTVSEVSLGIASGGIGSSHIAALAITNTHIATSAVTTVTIATDAVDKTKIDIPAAFTNVGYGNQLTANDFPSFKNMATNTMGGKFLIAEDSDGVFRPQAVTGGDVAIQHNGVAVIQAGAVETAMIANNAVDHTKLSTNPIAVRNHHIFFDRLGQGVRADSLPEFKNTQATNILNGKILVAQTGDNTFAPKTLGGDIESVSAEGAVVIADKAIQAEDLDFIDPSPPADHVIKWNGTIWTNMVDATGGGGAVRVLEDGNIRGGAVTNFDFLNNFTIVSNANGEVDVLVKAQGIFSTNINFAPYPTNQQAGEVSAASLPEFKNLGTNITYGKILIADNDFKFEPLGFAGDIAMSPQNVVVIQDKAVQPDDLDFIDPTPPANHVIKWDGAKWTNLVDATGGGGSIRVQENAVDIDSAVTNFNFSTAFDVTTPGATGEISIAVVDDGHSHTSTSVSLTLPNLLDVEDTLTGLTHNHFLYYSTNNSSWTNKLLELETDPHSLHLDGSQYYGSHLALTNWFILPGHASGPPGLGNSNGVFWLDTDTASDGINHGVLQYQTISTNNMTNMYVIAVHKQFFPPSPDQVITYNATSNFFEFADQTGSGGGVTNIVTDRYPVQLTVPNGTNAYGTVVQIGTNDYNLAAWVMPGASAGDSVINGKVFIPEDMNATNNPRLRLYHMVSTGPGTNKVELKVHGRDGSGITFEHTFDVEATTNFVPSGSAWVITTRDITLSDAGAAITAGDTYLVKIHRDVDAAADTFGNDFYVVGADLLLDRNGSAGAGGGATNLRDLSDVQVPADPNNATHVLKWDNTAKVWTNLADAGASISFETNGAPISSALAVLDFTNTHFNITESPADDVHIALLADGIDDTLIDFGTGAGQVSLGDLGHVGTINVTGGRILVADGADYESVLMQGDASIIANGTVTVADDLHDHVVGNIDAAASSVWFDQITDESGLTGVFLRVNTTGIAASKVIKWDATNTQWIVADDNDTGGGAPVAVWSNATEISTGATSLHFAVADYIEASQRGGTGDDIDIKVLPDFSGSDFFVHRSIDPTARMRFNVSDIPTNTDIQLHVQNIDGGLISLLDKDQSYTGTHDFSGATNLILRAVSTLSTVRGGLLGIDIDYAGFSNHVVQYTGRMGDNTTNAMGVLAMEKTDFTAVTNDYVVKYSAALDRIVWGADATGGGGGNVNYIDKSWMASEIPLLNDQIPTLQTKNNTRAPVQILSFDNVQSAGTMWAGPLRQTWPRDTVTQTTFIVHGYPNAHPVNATNAVMYRWYYGTNSWTVRTGTVYNANGYDVNDYGASPHSDSFVISGPTNGQEWVVQFANAPTGTVTTMSLTSSWNTAVFTIRQEF